MPDDYNPLDSARQNVNARVEQMWHDSPVRRAGAAIVDYNDRAGRAVADAAGHAYEAARSTMFPGRPAYSGQGRDIELPSRKSRRKPSDPRERGR